MVPKVLIVDDSKLARMAVAKTLNSLHPDWVSLEAPNADEALICIREKSPDFVLLDFNMPGQDGIALASELVQMDPNMRIAVISANRQVEVIKRTREAGATFLPKPLTEQALSEFLNAATALRQEPRQ